MRALAKPLSRDVASGRSAPAANRRTGFSGPSTQVVPVCEICVSAGPIASAYDGVLHAVAHGPTGTERTPHFRTGNARNIDFRDRKHGSEIGRARHTRHLTARAVTAALDIANECVERFAETPPTFCGHWPGLHR